MIQVPLYKSTRQNRIPVMLFRTSYPQTTIPLSLYTILELYEKQVLEKNKFFGKLLEGLQLMDLHNNQHRTEKQFKTKRNKKPPKLELNIDPNVSEQARGR